MKNGSKILLILFVVFFLFLRILNNVDVFYLADKYQVKGFDKWLEEWNNIKYESLYNKHREKYRRDGFGIDKNCKIINDFVYGFYFEHNSNDKIYWLNEEENKEFSKLLMTSYFDYISNRSFNDSLNNDTVNDDAKNVRFYGFFYAVPKWIDILGIKNIIHYFMPRIHMYYYPFQEHMYLSQDNEKLCYDCVVGIHITNVPSSLVYLDNKAIEEVIRK